MRGKRDEDCRVMRPEARLTIHVSREVRMKKLKMRKDQRITVRQVSEESDDGGERKCVDHDAIYP